MRRLTEKCLAELNDVEEGVIAGIITERDIISRVVINQKDPLKTKIEEIRIKGFSRIPIHLGENEQAVIGILLVKSLIGYKVP